jgi:hypothetical protein
MAKRSKVRKYAYGGDAYTAGIYSKEYKDSDLLQEGYNFNYSPAEYAELKKIYGSSMDYSNKLASRDNWVTPMMAGLGGIAGSLIMPGLGTTLGITLGTSAGKLMEGDAREAKLQDNMSKFFTDYEDKYLTMEASKANQLLYDQASNYNYKSYFAKGGKVRKGCANGGELKPITNNIFEVDANRSGKDTVNLGDGIYVDNNELIKVNPDGSMNIVSDDLNYADKTKAKIFNNPTNADAIFNKDYANQEVNKIRGKVKSKRLANGGNVSTAMAFNDYLKQYGYSDAPSPTYDYGTELDFLNTSPTYNYGSEIAKINSDSTGITP